MAQDALQTYGSLLLVTVGLAILLAGVGVYHSMMVQGVGGAITLVGVGILTVHLMRLDAPESAH
jgi:hypothetical protein